MHNLSTVIPCKGPGAQSAVNVTDASTEIIAANSARNYLLLQNNSDTDIHVNLTGAAASTSDSSSFKLASAGGSLELRLWVTTGAVTAIHGSAGNIKALTVLEG